MRYGYDLGCRNKGIPHNMKILHENPQVKWEACTICNKKFRWNKGYRGRVDNVAYLKAHVRNFAQKSGATRRVYNRVYSPEKMLITI